MHPLQIASTVLLVAALFVLGWRHLRGQSSLRPFTERTAIAACFLPVAWSAAIWLQAGRSDVSELRVVAVWVQLAASVTWIVLLLVAGWIRRQPASA